MDMTVLATAMERLDRCIELLASLNRADWRRSVPCAGWSVRHLAVHLCVVTDSYVRMGSEADDATAVRSSPRGRDHVVPVARQVEMLCARRAGWCSVFAPMAGAAEPALLTHPTRGRVSRDGAFDIMAAEYGVHCYDLECALGHTAVLPGAVCEAVARSAPQFLSGMGDHAPYEGFGFQLRACGHRIGWCYRGGSWTVDAAADTCLIEGDDATVLLFLLGRVPWTHPRLSVRGQRAYAAQFKTFFPGP